MRKEKEEGHYRIKQHDRTSAYIIWHSSDVVKAQVAHFIIVVGRIGIK